MITIIRDYLTRRGYTPPDVDWYKQISLYQGWYEGYVDSFHRYQVFNGTGLPAVTGVRCAWPKSSPRITPICC